MNENMNDGPKMIVGEYKHTNEPIIQYIYRLEGMVRAYRTKELEIVKEEKDQKWLAWITVIGTFLLGGVVGWYGNKVFSLLIG